MGTPPLSHDPDYFARMYADDDDPWGFERRWYEERKYDITLAALPQRSYRRAVEPGCANGVLTERLAERCEHLVAFDFVNDVVERARTRLAGREGVQICEAEFPTWWPNGTGDLVLWSEVAYYLTDDGLDVAADGLERWLESGGELVAVHYTGETDYPRSGRAVGRWLDGLAFLERVTTHLDESFELGVWRRVGSGHARLG